MMKKCTCKNGKTDPKCPACSKKDINLDSFHKLNPEAKPKTAEQFKLAAPGLWGGLAAGTKSRILEAGKAGLKSAVVPGTVAALGAGLAAEPGQGMADAARAGLAAGTLGAAAGAGHHLGMTGTGALAQKYQQTVGGDIRNMGNWGREQLGNPALPHPGGVAPKVARFYEFGKSAALTAFDI